MDPACRHGQRHAAGGAGPRRAGAAAGASAAWLLPAAGRRCAASPGHRRARAVLGPRCAALRRALVGRDGADVRAALGPQLGHRRLHRSGRAGRHRRRPGRGLRRREPAARAAPRRIAPGQPLQPQQPAGAEPFAHRRHRPARTGALPARAGPDPERGLPAAAGTGAGQRNGALRRSRRTQGSGPGPAVGTFSATSCTLAPHGGAPSRPSPASMPAPWACMRSTKPSS